MKQFCNLILLSCFIKFVSGDTYQVTDAGGVGRQFDGIGGLSGGGPGFGASLQILKVEIGGDDQSTDGTEASHMHEEWDENYNRGYEWWLMEEAKKRNPNIKLWGLSWAWPHWLGDPTAENNPYYDYNKTAMYTVKWIQGAKKYHNLTIDYIGIWNERYCDFTYILTLRQALNLNQDTKSVQIVACDTNFDDLDRMIPNEDVFNVVYAFGTHYPGTFAPQSAILSNKTLWSSEDYSTFNDDIGSGCWARILNQNYVNGFMTSTTAWNLIASYYLALPYPEDGLMTAVQPYSGYYEVKHPIWVTAHTTQFTEIGWKYLKHESGVGNFSDGGSYVTLISPNSQDLTIVIETMTYDHSKCIRPDLPDYNVTQQNATFKFGGTFSNLQNLTLWRTHFYYPFESNQSIIFQNQGIVKIKNGVLTLNLDVDSVYTLTTLKTGLKGQFNVTATSSPFPLPYEDNFQDYKANQEPNYLTPQVGSWEIVADDQNNQIARQTIITRPVSWCPPNYYPLAIIGDSSWTDLNVTATLRIPEVNGTNSVFVGIQVQTTNCDLYNAKGLFLWLNHTVSTYSITTDITAINVLKADVMTNEVKRNQWYTLSLSLKNGTVLAAIDGHALASFVLPSAYLQRGCAAIGSGSYGYSDVNYLKLSLPIIVSNSAVSVCGLFLLFTLAFAPLFLVQIIY